MFFPPPLVQLPILALNNWTSHDGFAFTKVDVRLSWAEAKLACQSVGAGLALPSTKSIQDFVTSQFASNDSTTAFWIGVSDIEKEDSHEFLDGASGWFLEDPGCLGCYKLPFVSTCKTRMRNIIAFVI